MSKKSVRPGGSGNTAARDFSDRDNGGDAWAGHKSTPAHGVDVKQNKDGTLSYSESNGTSIFDPVLCELVYNWFSPSGGMVLDPFAGGSVRGIVAARLGRQYCGVELRAEQVAANRVQADVICANAGPVEATDWITDPAEQTPIEHIGNSIWLKRDDLFMWNGVRGGKVRTCLALATSGETPSGLVTAGSRSSPQCNIVSHIAQSLGIPCRVHTPEGKAGDEVSYAIAAGADRVAHRAGYNNVIIKRAKDDAAALDWRNIPFGMECEEAVTQTRAQVPSVLPDGVTRIVAPVGSGMSLAGILHGLQDHGHDLPVLGIVVGADPVKRLDEYAPKNWRENVTLIESGFSYDTHINASLGDVELDPVYEAKCVKHLHAGDLLWVVGVRGANRKNTHTHGNAKWIIGDSRQIDQMCGDVSADLVFSCPPYADLEIYSDDPQDLSTLAYEDFKTAYFEIIAKACDQLKEDRFACFVVGDVRDKKGNYYNFVGDTVEAFRAAGLSYYNEAILVTAVGSLPIRAGRQFAAGRKLGKTHQNVLVFVKGDGKRAAQACGECDFGEVELTDQATA